MKVSTFCRYINIHVAYLKSCKEKHFLQTHAHTYMYILLKALQLKFSQKV